MSTADDALAGQLRRVLERVDPVPPEVLAAARASFGWQALEAELAQLRADDSLTTAPVRGAHQPRLLSFTAGDRGLELEVTTAEERMWVLGQVVPVQPARIRIEQAALSVEVTADQLGRFAFEDLPRGLTRVVCQPLDRSGEPAGTELVTQWQAL